jgi:hypothetical protein
LIKHGADLHHPNKVGDTPLLCATRIGHSEQTWRYAFECYGRSCPSGGVSSFVGEWSRL